MVVDTGGVRGLAALHFQAETRIAAGHWAHPDILQGESWTGGSDRTIAIWAAERC
jgi:hypothetical protein